MKQKNNSKKAFNPKKPVKAAENPFDKFANPRKKHEVVNRKVKGEDRNVGKARGKAVESRKKRLLDDYKASKKSNTFIDRRFGEDDPSMSLEEKNFLRLQKETQHSSKRYSSIFNLDEDNEVLTHGGSVLGASNIQDSSWVDEDAQDDNLNKDVVSSLHFGGGLVRKEGGDSGSTEPKTRLEALQEVVMKSKLHKMEKKESKDHQEDERARLDREFEELLTGSVIKYRPNKGEAGYDPAQDDVKEGGAAGKGDKVGSEYDLALRTMAFEAKVQPADRTKSAEELAAEAREKLEELEQARIARMKGGPIKELDAAEQGVVDAALEEEEAASGRRRKALTDDEDAFYTEYAVEKTKKQQKKAAKEAAKRKQADESEEETGSEEEDDWEDEEEAGGKAGSESDSDAGSDDDEEEDESGSEEGEESEDEYDREYKARLTARISAPKGGATAAAAKSKAKRAAEGAPAPVPAADASGVNEKMPHKIDCPATMEGFDELIDSYVVSTADMNALVERILVWNSVKLPGQQGANNRGPMHNFLDILIRHFVRVGNSLGAVLRSRPCGETAKTDRCSESVESVRSQLDFLTKAIHQLTSDIDTVSVALWRKTIKTQFISVLAKKLRDYSIGVDVVSCFPSLGRLMLIKLIGQIFSATDYTHALITPLVLYMCQCITQSPVNTPLDVSSGLFMTSMLLDFTAETNKYIPEVLLFLRSVVSLYFAPASAGFMRTARLGTFNSVSLSWLRGALGEPSSAAPGRLEWKFFGLIDSCKFDASGRSVDAALLKEWSYAIVSTVQTQIAEIRTRYARSVAFPEISCLLLEDLRVLRPQDSPAFPKSLLVRHVDELDELVQARNRCMYGGPAPAANTDGEASATTTSATTSARNPMQWRLASKKAISTLVPRYDVNYSLQMKNPFDPNKEKAKAKTLTKQLKREQKAAMRELRRDADYVEQEKFAVDTKKKEAARAERVRNYGILEQEQGMINQQVRMGKASDIKGGGSSGVGLKRARISKY